MPLSQIKTNSIATGNVTSGLIANAAVTPDKANTTIPSNAVVTTYTSGSGTFVVPAGVNFLDVLVVGGGGGGGQNLGGGGGGGQVIEVQKYSVTPGQSISYSIGAGGAAGTGTRGQSAAASGSTGGTTTFGNISALGGNLGSGADGGAGGAARSGGNKGGTGSGGTRAQSGGPGVISNISGVATTYAGGGGGGGCHNDSNANYLPPGYGAPGAGDGGWGRTGVSNGSDADGSSA